MTVISSQEIRQKAGIKATKTLTRWHHRGLIPPPSISIHPSGRGKIAYWEDWVLDRVREIKRLLAKGKGLDEIGEQLSSDWPEVAKRKIRKRRNLAKAMERDRREKAIDAFAESITDAVYAFLREIGVQRPGIHASLDDQLTDLPLIDRAVDLVKQGYNPVIVILGDDIKITTDFMLAHLAGRPEMQGHPMLVIPIHEEICEAYRDAVQGLPDKAIYAPPCTIVDQSGKRPKQKDYKMNSPWEHTIKPKK